MKKKNSESSMELAVLEETPQLFPTISSTVNTDSAPDSSSFLQETGLENHDVVVITDDGASSVCIDDYDADYQNALSVLKATTGTGAMSVGNSFTNNNASRSNPGNRHVNNNMSDFDAYNQRVAREVVLREKVERRQQRQQQRAKYFQNSRTYGNYFSQPNPSGMDTFTPSHTFDNFNGKRQNPNYNHQLNILNTPFTYEGRHMGNSSEQQVEQDGQAVQADDASFVTLDVDALQSEDDYEDEDDSLLDIHCYPDDSEQQHPVNNRKKIPKLKRKIYSRHLQMMSLGAAFGVGVLLNSGQSFFNCGALGTLLGYIITGLFVLGTMCSFGEMVALVPSESGVAGLLTRFVDKSLGFSIGICYWLSCAMALPSEVTAGAIMLSYYPELTIPTQSITVWITFFLVLVLIINLFDVGTFGEIQFVCSGISIILMVFLMIFMFALNSGDFNNSSSSTSQGRIGFRYWDYSKSNFDKNYIYGAFRPVYPLVMKTSDNGTLNVTGIGGATGRFVQVWMGICHAAFSYIGTEVVFMTAGEVRNPRKSVPAATRKIFIRVLLFYILAIFAVSINIFSGDPRLVNLNSKISDNEISGTVADTGLGGCVTGHVSWGYNMSGSNSSPWIIAIQTVGHCSFAAGINSTFVFLALVAGISHLYSASRTLYGLAAQGLVWRGFGTCTYAGVPYVSILTSFAFSMLAYLTANHTSAQVFEWLVALTTSAGLLVWAGICFAFIRFYKGLKLRPDLFASRSRNGGVLYPYKSPFQPYTAYFALTMNCLVALLLGLPVFFRGQWNTGAFFTNYVSVLVCVICYAAHKLYTRSKLVPLDQVDLDTGRKEMERAGWHEDRVYNRGWGQYLKEYGIGIGTIVGLVGNKMIKLVRHMKRRRPVR